MIERVCFLIPLVPLGNFGNFLYPALWCLSEVSLEDIGPFCLVSMLGEVKDLTRVNV